MPSHPSFEDLSAFHDGEAPEWAAHVAACAECRDQLGQLSALSAAVARPAAPMAGADDPVRVALAASDDGASSPSPAGASASPRAGASFPSPSGAHPVAPPAPARPGPARWLPWAASAAAALLLVVGVLAVVTRSAGDRPTTSAIDEQPESSAGEAGQGLAADAAGPPSEAVAGGDLGEIPDAATMLLRARPGLQEARAAVAPSPQGASLPPARRVVGTRPCEVEARSRDGSLGPVVYHATARRAGTAAVVLGFAPVAETGPITVQMLAQGDCRLLLSATSP